jgi:S-adenosylmethionine:tRNA-ribosyltransferase-isomerase (queuine synthetase)
MLVSDFHYDLPEELIAQQPPAVRGTSRMMTLDRRSGAFADRAFADLPSLLRAGDLLVMNDSRVIPARLFATRAGLTTQHNSPAPSGHVEVLLTERLASPEGHNDWTALVRPAKKVQPNETLLFRAPVQMEANSLKGTGFSPSMKTEVEKGALAPEAIRSAAIAWAIYGATREALNTPNYHSTESIAATVITLIAPLLTPPQSPSS